MGEKKKERYNEISFFPLNTDFMMNFLNCVFCFFVCVFLFVCLFFGHAIWLVETQFSDQESTLGPWQLKC